MAVPLVPLNQHIRASSQSLNWYAKLPLPPSHQPNGQLFHSQDTRKNTNNSWGQYSLKILLDNQS